jgi:hypothetical protein
MMSITTLYRSGGRTRAALRAYGLLKGLEALNELDD